MVLKTVVIVKTLYLNIKKQPFEVMFTGEKNREYRKPSKWIESRLFNKDGSVRNYDVVKVTLGYGNTKPHFIAKYINVIQTSIAHSVSYSNGLNVEVEENDYQILLGEIIERQYEQSKFL
jgi:hypothetical protein